jgi:hypothetical protein
MSSLTTFTSVIHAGTTFRRGSDKESDTDSHTDQSIGTSAECSTDTSHAISWEELSPEQGDKADGAWGNISSRSLHSPPLVNSPAMNLHPQQLERLKAVLYSMVIIDGDSNKGFSSLPTLACRPVDFVEVLLRNLACSEIKVNEVRLYGGAATYVISESSSFFNDIDLMINVDFNALAQHLYLDGIKCVVLKTLREIVTDVLSKSCLTDIPTANILDDGSLTRAYISKMYRHIKCEDSFGNDNKNIWSLFSFNNYQGRNIEVKFVHTLKRQYTFSLDSWQIDLSSFLPKSKLNRRSVQQSNRQSTICYCLFPDIEVAYEDVKKRHIRVIKPETVRGGCFLRYGDLLHKGYSPPSSIISIMEQELVMLERFLADFGNPSKQSEALDRYLLSHMGACTADYKLMYLRLLDGIVERLRDHAGADNMPSAASTLTCVIKSKVRKFQMVSVK